MSNLCHLMVHSVFLLLCQWNTLKGSQFCLTDFLTVSRAYVETLFGHQDSICGIDCGSRERCITVGGRDATARLWKIVEESQLVFNGPQSSLDCVKLLNEEHWVTAGEDGHLAVWGVQKKKPLALVSRQE